MDIKGEVSLLLVRCFMDSKPKAVVFSSNKVDCNAPKIEADLKNVFQKINGKIIASG